MTMVSFEYRAPFSPPRTRTCLPLATSPRWWIIHARSQVYLPFDRGRRWRETCVAHCLVSRSNPIGRSASSYRSFPLATVRRRLTWSYRVRGRLGVAMEGPDRSTVHARLQRPARDAAARAAHVPVGLADEEAIATLKETAMRCGGCGAKVGVSADACAATGRTIQLRERARWPRCSRRRGGGEGGDSEAMVHTVDFFRSIIDDPYVRPDRGQSLIERCVCHGWGTDLRTGHRHVPPGPEAKVEETLIHLMAGATAVLREAGVPLVGGHTSEGAELGLGFSVNGRIEQARVRKSGLRAGDRLILTKPVGTGTLFAADMRHLARGRWIEAAVTSMVRSNRQAACCVLRHGATACTDVTGFGLAGHLVEMLRASAVYAEIDLGAVHTRWGRADRRARHPQLASAAERAAASRHRCRTGRGRTSTIRPALRSADIRWSAGRCPGVGRRRVSGNCTPSAIARAPSSARSLRKRIVRR